MKVTTSSRSARSATLRDAAGAGLRLRLRVLVHRWEIDRHLAVGRCPENSEPLALRAQQLGADRTRRRLANALRRTATRGRHRSRPGPFCSAVPLRPGVEQWVEALIGLAERLEQPVQVNACGIARALEFLTDGAGPLYNPACPIPIGTAIWHVADGLELCPPHAWGCPVTMKVDPGRVAWTCERCGAIATTNDRALRPA